MKSGKKLILTAICALLLVVATVFGTMAWLVDTDNKVVNTFTIGDIDITLDETDVDDSTPDETRDTDNTYQLVPGAVLDKDPVIHFKAGSEKAWLFVEIENGLSGLEYQDGWAEGDGFDYSKVKPTIFVQMTQKYQWVKMDESDTDGRQIFYKKMPVEKTDENQDFHVFDKVFIQERIQDLTNWNNAQVIVKAYAVQADENIDNIDEAWNTIRAQTAPDTNS